MIFSTKGTGYKDSFIYTELSRGTAVGLSQDGLHKMAVGWYSPRTQVVIETLWGEPFESEDYIPKFFLRLA